MSTRVIRSMHDFGRHGMDIECVCDCGHSAVLEHNAVLDRFRRNRWSTSLTGAIWLPSAHRYFYCSRCHAAGKGKRRPVRIGPGVRG